jgi:Flp pilus assembly protein TadG
MKMRRKGISTIYMILFMSVLCAFASLAVDFGRVQLAKTELHRAADGAARAGAAGITDDAGTAIALAKQYALLNNVDAHPLTLQSGDITFGKWNAATATFTTQADFANVNAIWIKAKLDARRGTAVPLMFAPIIAPFTGIKTCNVSADVIAMVIPPVNVNQFVPATANPFLAGMPQGTLASVLNPSNRHIPDIAGTASNPMNSPLAVAMPVIAGQPLTFDSIDGDARHDPGLSYSNPDGDISDPNDPIGHNNDTTTYDNNYSSTMANENGIADAWIPINSLVGVFLDDNAPNTTPAPANLDFRTDASRDFQTLQPQLKQLFFIGDGLDSHGNHQQFITPPGATRLYLATMDYYEWNNNAGSRNIKVNRPMSIITVK